MSKVGVSVSLSCIDVTDFDIPTGKIVIYLFNPFGEERMTDLVSRLACREEETLVIYHNPKHSECFENYNKIKTYTWYHFCLYLEKVSFFLIAIKAKN